MKELDQDARVRLLQRTAAGVLHPPIKPMPLEARRAARALLRMKPAH